MPKVKSSNIEEIEYDPEAKEMTVKFTSGSVYRYSNVAQLIYDGFLAAESHGKHFAQHIRPHFTGKKHEAKA